MLMRILAAGLVGGIAGGIVVGAIESVTTVPLILHAEEFEVHDVASAAQVLLAHVHSDGHAAAGEGGGGSRMLLTFVATVAAAVGYMWMLLAVMYARGTEINVRTILPFAIAGFVATGLAPALGLAPELPGSSAAALEARQIWWIGTAVATAIGLGAMFFGRTLPWVALGVVLMVLPHVVGAPHPAEMESQVPAELAAHFAATSLVVQALIWIVPAAIAGYAASLFRPAATAA